MLGLAVLFGLVVWVAITLFSIKFGSSLAKTFSQRKNAQYMGAFLGFMLSMGGVLLIGQLSILFFKIVLAIYAEQRGV